jgi:hypothetical protein
MVLLALARAASWTVRKVAYEDLVLQAWQDYPAEFSLRNHPEHPDASDIHKRIYQGLKPAGSVLSMGNKIFRLTERGLQDALALDSRIASSPSTSPAGARLARQEQAFVEHALASRAFATWSSGEREALIDYDALVFFQFGTGTGVVDRRLRLAFATATLEKAASLGMSSARELTQLSAFLHDRFPQLWSSNEEGEQGAH